MTAPTTDDGGRPAVNDFGKMALLALALVCTSVLRAIDAVDSGTWGALFTLVVGYLIGNGVNAVRKQPGSPALIARGAAPALVTTPAEVVPVVPVPEPAVILPPAPAFSSPPDEDPARPMAPPEVPR